MSLHSIWYLTTCGISLNWITQQLHFMMSMSFQKSSNLCWKSSFVHNKYELNYYLVNGNLSLSILMAIFQVELAGTRMPPFWTLLELGMMQVVVTTGAIRCGNASVKMSPPTNQHRAFYRLDGLLSPSQQCQNTEGTCHQRLGSYDRNGAIEIWWRWWF